MASETAKAVARDVKKSLGKTRINLGEILRKNGYAEGTSLTPQNVTQTKSFQAEMEPVIKQMERERDRILKAMAEKDLTEVQYQHLAEVADKFTKNIQLLGGKPTENNKIEVEWLK